MKTMKKLAGFCCVVLLLAGCGPKAIEIAMRQGAVRLDGNQVEALVSGNTLLVEQYDDRVRIIYHDNGKLDAENLTVWDTSDGVWKVEGDRLCMKFGKWGYERKNCYAIYQVGDEYRQFDSGGQLISTLTVVGRSR